MSKVFIIDGNSLLFRSFYALFRPGMPVMTSSAGIPTNAIFGFRNMMKQIKGELHPDDRMIVCFDTGRKSFRSEKLESYKMNRKPTEPELKAQMPIAREMLDAMDIFHCEKEGYEGDDIAGSLACYAAKKGDEVVLFTSDKDWLQLLHDGIRVDFLRKGLKDIQVFSEDNIHEQMGFKADQVTDYKGLAGDPSDNIPGVKGIGDKTAKKLLDEYPHLEEIFAGIKDDKSKAAMNILANQETALFCREIATIKTDMDVKDYYDQGGYKECDLNKVLSFYKKYDLKKFALQVQDELNKKAALEQPSLFDMDNKEEASASDLYEEASSFSQLGFLPSSLLAYNSDPNFHKGEIKGFFFSDGEKTGFINAGELKGDADFVRFVTGPIKKSTYDLKGLEVVLARLGLEKSANVDFDLQLAVYLLDDNVVSRMEDCLAFFNKDISPLSEEGKYAYTCKALSKLEAEVISRLEKDDEKPLFEEVEMPLCHVLSDMEIEGFPMDVKTMKEIDDEYQGRLNAITKGIYDLIGHEINLNSPRQVSSLIYDELKLRRKGKNNPTDIAVLNSIRDRHPCIPMIIEYRKYQKIVSSYTSNLSSFVFPDGKIHAVYNQAVTSTGRLSMQEPNLQNISIRDEDGKEIRKAFFYPDKEFYFLSLDYSQVELRVLASMAGLSDMIEVFRSGEDIHASTASKVFGVKMEDVTSLMRRKAKAVNFGIVYGISPWGLSEQIHCSPLEADSIIKSFYNSYPGLKEYENRTIRFAHDNGYVQTLLKRRRYLNGINSDNKNVLAFSERAAVNATIQGSAADLIKVAMIKIEKLLKDYKTKMILQIHDELIFKVPPSEKEAGIDKKIEDIMEHAIELACPLKAEGSYGLSWFECK